MDNTDAGTWRVPDDVWENTNTFGYCYCNEDYTNDPDCPSESGGSAPGAPGQPSDECIAVATDFCGDLWDQYKPGTDCENDVVDDDWLQNCIFDACAGCGDDLESYGYTFEDALNSGCLDTALNEMVDRCDIEGAEEGFEAQCYACPTQCTELTTEDGCANDQCM